MTEEDRECGTCHGRGQIWVQVVTPKEEPGHWVPCTRCGGSGRVAK